MAMGRRCEHEQELFVSHDQLQQAPGHPFYERLVVHVAGFNLGLLMRHIVGSGTARQAVAALRAQFLAAVWRHIRFLGLLVLPNSRQRRRHPNSPCHQMPDVTTWMNALAPEKHRLSTAC
jgi:hypothetical protein